MPFVVTAAAMFNKMDNGIQWSSSYSYFQGTDGDD